MESSILINTRPEASSSPIRSWITKLGHNIRKRFIQYSCSIIGETYDFLLLRFFSSPFDGRRHSRTQVEREEKSKKFSLNFLVSKFIAIGPRAMLFEGRQICALESAIAGTWGVEQLKREISQRNLPKIRFFLEFSSHFPPWFRLSLQWLELIN